MKKIALLLGAALVSLGASAQYYDMANQAMQMIAPALSGAANYKGYVDVEYLQGIGSNRANFVDITTTQGYRFNNWFFMGVGAGVDIIMANKADNWGSNWNNPNGFDTSHSSTQTGVMIPLFSDFRFTIGGNTQGIKAFIDVRLGASFLMSNDYIQINNGFLSNSECFYLRPAIGVRVPVSKNSPKQAVNVGLAYQLITGNYWYNYSNNVTLSALGVNVGFEW